MKGIEALRNQVAIQGQSGNWNCNSYMLGMFNGLECALATMEGREPQYKSAPEKWLDDLSLPASSGPEQTKCKTCDDMGVLVEKNTPYPGAETCRGICPDCPKDRTEPKCVCGREAPVCSSGWLSDAHWKLCQNMVAGRPCAHPIECHTPAPAAKEVMPRSE